MWFFFFFFSTRNEKDFPTLGFGKEGGQIGRYYLCRTSEGGVRTSLLKARREKSLPLRETMAVVLHSFCFGVFLKKKEILTAESWLAHMREYEEVTGGVITASPGQSSPPLNSSLNVYWLPLTRVCALICVCVCACTEMNVCFEKGTEFLVDFLSFFMFVLFNFLWILKMYSCEEGCARVHVWEAVMCVCARQSQSYGLAAVCVSLWCYSLAFHLTGWRLRAEGRRIHTKKQTKQESDHEDPTSAVSRNLEIENYDVCDILRFLCPVFTWLVCFYCFSNPSLSVRLCCL